MSKQPKLAWIDEAFRHLGTQEIKGIKHNPKIIQWLDGLNAWWKDDETAWCGVYVAWCLRSAGIKYPKLWMQALAYLKDGAKLSKPCYGCVAIKKRKGGGHVCFIVGKDKATGKLVCLGGNQSDKVCLALYSQSEFEEFRWYGKTSKPLAIRYDLPEYSGITAQKVSEA